MPKGGWGDFMDNLAFSPLLLSFAVFYRYQNSPKSEFISNKKGGDVFDRVTDSYRKERYVRLELLSK